MVYKQLMRDSWPLLLAGASSQVYSQIDTVMIQHSLSSVSVGLYSSATKLTQIFQAFPGIIIASLMPALINARAISRSEYLHRFRSLLSVTIGISALFIMPVFFLAPFIILAVFGVDFLPATSTMRIHMWSTFGIVIVALLQKYLIIENFAKIFFVTTIIGATTNTALNLFLIPRFGINGAALTTVLSYIVMIISIFFFKKTRQDLYDMMRT